MFIKISKIMLKASIIFLQTKIMQIFTYIIITNVQIFLNLLLQRSPY